MSKLVLTVEDCTIDRIKIAISALDAYLSPLGPGGTLEAHSDLINAQEAIKLLEKDLQTVFDRHW